MNRMTKGKARLPTSLAQALARDLGALRRGTQRRAAIEAGWTPTMEQRADLEGRQVKCLIASEGHLWMRNYFDRLPSAVRRRLAQSAFNICPACMDEEARMAASQRNETKPTVAIYFAVIEAIEQKLDQQKNE
jgi:hypothetical protein